MGKEKQLIGDKIEEALAKVNADRLTKIVQKVTGKPCGCKRRKERLNRLHQSIRNMKK